MRNTSDEMLQTEILDITMVVQAAVMWRDINIFDTLSCKHIVGSYTVSKHTHHGYETLSFIIGDSRIRNDILWLYLWCKHKNTGLYESNSSLHDFLMYMFYIISRVIQIHGIIFAFGWLCFVLVKVHFRWLTYLPLVPHICTSELCQ